MRLSIFESSTFIVVRGSIFRFLEAVVVYESLITASSLWLSLCHSAGPSSLLKVVMIVLIIDSSVMRLKLTFAFYAADWKPVAWMWSLNWLKCSTVNVFKFSLIFNSSFSITLSSSTTLIILLDIERSSLYVINNKLSMDVKVSKLVSYLLVEWISACSLKILSYWIISSEEYSSLLSTLSEDKTSRS